MQQILIALYLRVSTDDQKTAATIENQIRELEEYLKQNPQFKVYKWYKDDGVSGTIPFTERPAGKQLIEDAKAKKFEMVLVTRTDRFGRSMIGILKSVEILENLNIKFRAILEPFNTEEPAGRYMFNNMANFSEYDINSIKQRLMHGINRAAENGKWPGGVPPYGFTLDKDRHLIIYDEKVIFGIYSEADIIKKIFYLVAECKMTCKKAADILNSEGIPTVTIKNNHLKRKKANWSSETIRQLIKNEVYKGTFIFGKRSKDPNRKIIINVEPIVSETIWDAAQGILKQNIITSPRNAKNPYLLTGKIRCSECGKTFTGLQYRGYTYYACSGFRFKSSYDNTRCINSLIRADSVEKEIWKDISEFIKKPDRFKEFIQSKLSDKNEFNAAAEVEKRKKKLESIAIQKSKLIKLIRFGDNYLEKDILVELEKIKNEEKTIIDELNYYNDLISNVEKQNQKVIEIEKLLSSFMDKIDNPDFKLKKEIVRLLLKEVIVYPKNLETKSRDVELNYCFNKDIILTKLSLTG